MSIQVSPITASQSFFEGMKIVGGNVNESIVNALPRGVLFLATGALLVSCVKSLYNINYGTYEPAKELVKVGAVVIGMKILDYVGNQKNFFETKHKLHDALIAKAQSIHPEWEVMSDAEILNSIEDNLTTKFSGRGIEYFVKVVVALPEDKRAHKIDKLARILVKK